MASRFHTLKSEKYTHAHTLGTQNRKTKNEKKKHTEKRNRYIGLTTIQTESSVGTQRDRENAHQFAK